MFRKFFCAFVLVTSVSILAACTTIPQSDPQPRLEVTWLGGPTVIFEFNGLRILTDPTFGDGAEAFTMGDPNEMFDLSVGPNIKYHKRLTPFPGIDSSSIDLVILSHAHEDHFDQKAQAKLSPTVSMILPIADTEKVKAMGFENMDSLRWGDKRTLKAGPGQVTITAITAHHSENSDIDKILGVGNGYWIKFFLVDGCEFDTIYHEHRCYYSLTALDHLFRQHELRISDVERLKIHGGSLRLYVTHSEATGTERSVGSMLKQEEQLGLQTLEYYRNFSAKVERLTTALSDSLGKLKENGCHVAGYGAAAKGSVLLNACGLDNEIVDFVVDRNDNKQGRYIPGCRIPISPPERLLEAMPDYVLILIWNLAEEIQEQQAEYHRRGGKFIVPIPEINII